MHEYTAKGILKDIDMDIPSIIVRLNGRTEKIPFEDGDRTITSIVRRGEVYDTLYRKEDDFKLSERNEEPDVKRSDADVKQLRRGRMGRHKRTEPTSIVLDRIRKLEQHIEDKLRRPKN